MNTKLTFSKEDKAILKRVYDFSRARKVKLYLVGGALRDLLLGRKKVNPDFDFCLKRKAIAFGRRLASEMKAGFVVLDKGHGACRIVRKEKDRTVTLDFTDFRGKNLEDDLLHRDFTINAIALELGLVFRKADLYKGLIDLYGGIADIKRKVIRIVHKDAFLEDPLRILRTFSFACILGFEIEKKTLRLARLERKKLNAVSGERIRDELFKIFDTLKTYEFLVLLDKLTILSVLFPEIEKMRKIKQGPYHHLDIWKHSLETVRQLELILRQKKHNDALSEYLAQQISGERKRRAIMKLAALLHDIGKPDTLRRKGGKINFYGHERVGRDISERIVLRLKLSNDEVGSLKRIIFSHLRPGYLADNETLTPRATFRYFRDTGSDALSVLLTSLSDQRATRGRLTTQDSRERHEKLISRLIKEYFKRKKAKKLIRLVNGNELIEKFGLNPSPLVGKLLAGLEELQAIGKIATKEGALRAAGRILKARSGNPA